MSFKTWLEELQCAEKSSYMEEEIRKVFYKFKDGRQMFEEYSMETGVIQKRAWRTCKQLMQDPKWELELGEMNFPFAAKGNDEFTLMESNMEPTVTKRITKRNIEWRIRNLPYPIEVYQVGVLAPKYSIVVRTTNKKYYKEMYVHELARCNEQPQKSNISLHHQYNTLIITYNKPEILCKMEVEVLRMLKDVETETRGKFINPFAN